MDLAASVRAEQIRALFRQSPLLLWTNVAISALVSLALWWSASRPCLFLWVLSMALVAIARSALMARYAAVNLQIDAADGWGQRFVLAAVVAGCIWGVGAVVFFDTQSPVSQILLTF